MSAIPYATPPANPGVKQFYYRKTPKDGREGLPEHARVGKWGKASRLEFTM